MTAPPATTTAAPLDEGEARFPTTREWLARRDLWVVVAIFAAVEIGYALAGFKLILTPRLASRSPQVLDPSYFSHSLWQSIWYLHMQPPLYNLQYAILDRIGSVRLLWLLNGAFAFVLCVGTYFVAIELRIHRWVAVALAGLAMASPSLMLFQNFNYSSLNTEATLVVLVGCAARYFRTGTWPYAAVACWCAACLVLGNSTFQLVFVVGLVGYMVWVRRAWWRQVLACAVVPVALVLAWYVKTAIVFGVFTTSSWLGMNLAHVTIDAAPRPTIQHLVDTHVLTPLALVAPFSAPSAYVPRFAPLPRTGIRVLDAARAPYEGPNFNNLAYVSISSQYLRDDLAYIRADPGGYAANVWKAAKLWFVPADRYYWALNRHQVTGYANGFDRVVALEPSLWPITKIGATATVDATEVSYSLVLVYLVTMIGLPIAYFRFRRRIRLPYAACGLVWCCIAYVFVVTTFLDYGENNRFRIDLGSLPLLCAVALLSAVWRTWRAPAADGAPGRGHPLEAKDPEALTATR